MYAVRCRRAWAQAVRMRTAVVQSLGRARARRVQFLRTRAKRADATRELVRWTFLPCGALLGGAQLSLCRRRALGGDERGRGGRAAEEGPRQVQLHHQGQRERANERASERERNRFLGLTSQSSARIGRSCGAEPLPRERFSLSLQVSVAAQDLIDFTKTRQDPFHPECSPAENPWIGGSKSGRSQRRTCCHGRATQRPRLVSRVARPIPG